jgi:N-acetylglutamate synthase-like GNAT family acetyltransferase
MFFHMENRGVKTHFIRRAVASDAEGIHNAHMKSIQEMCAKDYSPEQIRAWGGRGFHEESRVRAIGNDFVWVVEGDGIIEGYGHLKIIEKDGVKHGHVFGLYFTPKVVGKSFGKAIVRMMIEEMKAAKIKTMRLESTITSQTFYRHMGFINDGPEIKIDIGGVSLACYPMFMEVPQ